LAPLELQQVQALEYGPD